MMDSTPYLASTIPPGPDEKLQRSSRMADPQDQPDNTPDPAPPPPTDTAPAAPPPATEPEEPAQKAPAEKAVAKKVAPAKAAKKPAAKKAAAKKAPAKKAAAKKAPAKKAAAKKIAPAAATPGTNGQLTAAAKDAAAHAKSTVETARNPLPAEPAASSPGRSPVPLVVAIVISLLAILLVRQLRKQEE
jgi:hypothetical protein